MNVDIVIPNYNGSALIAKNLPSVLKSLEKYKGSKIIIVDDGSKESEKESLKIILKKSNSKKIIFVENEKNLGFSSAVNRGVKESNAEFVTLLNSDAAPEFDFLDHAIKNFEKNENLFAVGCMDKSIEDGKVVMRGRGIAKFEKGFVRHRRGDINNSSTFWVSGGSCIVKKDIFDKIGGFDEIFNPFYWEDIDLSYRAQKAGYTVLFEKKSVVIHRHSEGAIKKYYDDTDVTKIAFRNELFFIWKNITDKFLLFAHFIYLVKYLFVSLIKKRFYVWAAFIKACKNIPAIMAKRKKQKDLCKVNDREIFAKFK